jgi:serine/threonine protein phosphatase PrpC
MLIEISQHVLGYRRVCQDSIGVFDKPDGVILVVADGAGGIEDGEVASRVVVDTVKQASRDTTSPTDWSQVLRNADHAIGSGQSTACAVELSSTGLRGASVGDSRVGMIVGEDLVFPSDGQQRKPLLGSGDTEPRSFTMPWDGGLVIVGSDGFWNYVNMGKLLANLHFIEFPVMAKTLAEMVRMPSGNLADDVAVICARRRRSVPARRRIDLLAEDGS